MLKWMTNGCLHWYLLQCSRIWSNIDDLKIVRSDSWTLHIHWKLINHNTHQRLWPCVRCWCCTYCWVSLPLNQSLSHIWFKTFSACWCQPTGQLRVPPQGPWGLVSLVYRVPSGNKTRSILSPPSWSWLGGAFLLYFCHGRITCLAAHFQQCCWYSKRLWHIVMHNICNCLCSVRMFALKLVSALSN